MTIEQTLTIPKETNHLTVDLPQSVPAGTATFRLEWTAASPKSKKELAVEAIEALCGLYESDGHDVDRFLESSHEEKLREYEIEEHEQKERGQYSV
ncbi:hypothetical protein AGMMS49944_00190 [Spirochaetia bacterium]|nr:hypothetical protein AGMMS49944_00190 [Spirochaetia bacterium]